MRLTPAHDQVTYRVSRISRGPLDPPPRVATPTDVTDWGRYDIPGGRTIYVGDSKRTAYSEVAAYIAPPVGVAPTRLSDVFDDYDSTDPTTVMDAITNEWDALFSITPQKIVAGWRDARNCFAVTLPPSGWFIDITHRDSLRALNKSLATRLGAMGINRLTTAHLVGQQRTITVPIAKWCHDLVLFDGSLPHGIIYPSKHGNNCHCWAVWLRQLADGKELNSEPTRASPGAPILAPSQDIDLKWVADTMDIIFL